MDDLGVEDDATDLLAAEQVVRRGPAEALEATLRVGNRTRNPARGQRVEYTAEQSAVEWLRPAPIAAVGVDPAAEGDVMAGQRFGEQRELIGRRGEVSVGEQDEFALRVEHSGSHGRAFASVRTAQQSQLSGRSGGGRVAIGDDCSRRVGAAVVDDENLHPAHVRCRAATFAPRTSPLQVAEELVERRPDPGGLVVGRQNEGDAGFRRVLGERRVGRGLLLDCGV